MIDQPLYWSCYSAITTGKEIVVQRDYYILQKPRSYSDKDKLCVCMSDIGARDGLVEVMSRAPASY